jgi:hypothetical protein
VTDPIVVCEAVVARLQPILLDWNGVTSEPSPFPQRCFIVEPDPVKGADYTTKPPCWFLRVGLYALAVDQMGSLKVMAPLAGTKGPIIKALRDTMCDYDDDLSKLSQSVMPTTLTGFKIIRRNRNRYRQAFLNFTVLAN